MWKSKKLGVLVVVLTLASIGVWRLTAGTPSLEQQRTKLTKAYNDGNYKVAYDGLRKLALDPKNDPKVVGKDLDLAIHSLQKLGPPPPLPRDGKDSAGGSSSSYAGFGLPGRGSFGE